MHKKAAAASQAASMKELHNKIAERLASGLTEVDALLTSTNLPQYAAVPNPGAIDNLLESCRHSPFWQNFEKAAPILFCMGVESQPQLK